MPVTAEEFKNKIGGVHRIRFNNGNPMRPYRLLAFDEKYSTVRLVNVKGLLELKQLATLKGSALTSEEESVVIDNPRFFSVFPLEYLVSIEDAQ